MKVIFIFIRKLMTVLMKAWSRKPVVNTRQMKDKPFPSRKQLPQATIYSMDAYIKEKQRKRQQAHALQPKRARAVPDQGPQRPPRDTREEWQIRCDNRKSRFRSSA